MGCIHQHFCALFVCCVCDSAGRQDLTVPIDDVGDVNDTCFGRKLRRVGIREVILVSGGQIQIYPNQFDAIAFFALFPGINHVWIIIFG